MCVHVVGNEYELISCFFLFVGIVDLSALKWNILMESGFPKLSFCLSIKFQLLKWNEWFTLLFTNKKSQPSVSPNLQPTSAVAVSQQKLKTALPAKIMAKQIYLQNKNKNNINIEII